jgi:hypothetical protein
MRNPEIRRGRPPIDKASGKFCNISIKMTQQMHINLIAAAQAQSVSKAEIIRKQLINLPETEKSA